MGDCELYPLIGAYTGPVIQCGGGFLRGVCKDIDRAGRSTLRVTTHVSAGMREDQDGVRGTACRQTGW